MKSCLHLLCAPAQDALAACIAHGAEGDCIVFLDAGVLQLFRNELAALSGHGWSLRFLAADLQAHGLLQSAQDLAFDVIEDAEFATLLPQYDHCLSWK